MKRALLLIILMVSVALVAKTQNVVKYSHDSGTRTGTDESKGYIVIYEQLNAGGNTGYPSTDWWSYDVSDCYAADDFIIPAGETWNIDSVFWWGLWLQQTSTVDNVNIFFYNDNNGVPGTEVTSFMNISCITDYWAYDFGTHSVILPERVSLTEGIYWISIQTQWDYSSDVWFWVPNNPVVGNESHWKNPGEAYISGFPDWTPGSVVFECDQNDQVFGFYELITYTITFYVDDGTDPIDGADITINGQTVTTADGGMASVDLDEGTYTYTVTALGFDDFTGNYTVTTDANQTILVHMNETVSVKNLNASEIRIFPNPSKGMFNIDVNSNFNLEVIDITGNIVRSLNLSENSTVEISAAGIYFFRFSNNEKTIVKKVVVN